MKVAYVSGTRADYGLMRSTLNMVHRDGAFDLGVIATGMHLSKEFGQTLNEIENEGFEIMGKVDMLLYNDSNSAMSKGLGLAILGISQILENEQVEIMIVQGDRGEALAGSIAAAHMNIPVIHVSGGDRTGSIDDKIRHSISCFSDYHFPATNVAAERLYKIPNVLRERTKIVGEPGLDDIINREFGRKDELYTKYGIDPQKRTILIIQHPVTGEIEQAGEQVNLTLEAVVNFDAEKLIILPNSDAGGMAMRQKINDRSNEFLIFANIPRDDFLSFLKHVDILVGNSSAGIVEAPSFQLPVVNIGTRQDGRIQAANVLNADYDLNEIEQQIKKGLTDEFRTSLKGMVNPYGEGKTAEKIIRHMREWFI